MNSKDNWIVQNTEPTGIEEVDVITYQISSYPSDLTLKGYLDKWNEKQLYIPPFQRYYVWDQVQASKLIESFLLGLPVPGVFLYKERKSNRLQIIDGQQRISSVIRYFTNDFDGKPFRLKNVQPKWEGKKYMDLSEPDRYQLNDTVLRATIVQQLDPEDDSSIYHIFERLNTGGVKLSPMEIRKCVYLSEFYKLLEKLNTNENWRNLLGKKMIDKRLRDIEFILRIIGLYEYLNLYEKPMKQFLNQIMSKKRNMRDRELEIYLEKVSKEFIDVCNFTYDQLGEKPFHLRGRLNYAVMDSTMCTGFRVLQQKITNFNERYEKMLKDKDYLESVSYNTSDEKIIQKRFSIAEQYLLR